MSVDTVSFTQRPSCSEYFVCNTISVYTFFFLIWSVTLKPKDFSLSCDRGGLWWLWCVLYVCHKFYSTTVVLGAMDQPFLFQIFFLVFWEQWEATTITFCAWTRKCNCAVGPYVLRDQSWDWVAEPQLKHAGRTGRTGSANSISLRRPLTRSRKKFCFWALPKCKQTTAIRDTFFLRNPFLWL